MFLSICHEGISIIGLMHLIIEVKYMLVKMRQSNENERHEVGSISLCNI